MSFFLIKFFLVIITFEEANKFLKQGTCKMQIFFLNTVKNCCVRRNDTGKCSFLISNVSFQ